MTNNRVFFFLALITLLGFSYAAKVKYNVPASAMQQTGVSGKETNECYCLVDTDAHTYDCACLYYDSTGTLKASTAVVKDDAYAPGGSGGELSNPDDSELVGDDDDDLSGGAIAGIVIGSLIAFGALVFAGVKLGPKVMAKFRGTQYEGVPVRETASSPQKKYVMRGGDEDA